MLSALQVGAALLLCLLPFTAFADVKLGVAGPMSGVNAIFGTRMRNGAGLAAADANRAGGLFKQKIVLMVGDDHSDPRQAVTTANGFVAAGVKFVVGHFNSSTSIPASLVYLDHDVLMITPSAVSPQVTEMGRWNVFRLAGRDDRQAEVAGAYLVAHFKGRKIAFLHDRTPYGRELADAVRAYVNAHGVNEVMAEGVDPGLKTYTAIVDKLKAKGADVLFWGGGSIEAALLIDEMHDAGLATVLMGGDAVVGSELGTAAGPAVVGTLMTFPPDDRKRPQAAGLLAQIQAGNKDPIDYSFSSYAAVQILQAAVEKAASLDPAKIAAVMHSGMTFETIIGDISFDAKGDITRRDFIVYTWRQEPDGTLRYVPAPP